MGRRELEAALLRDGEDMARQIWQQAESVAARLREETGQLRARQRSSAGSRWQADSAALREETLTAARRQARQRRLAAESAVAARLQRLAEGLLAELALTGGEGLFLALAGEIPDHPWQQVKVNQRDRSSAKKRFSQAEIQSVEGISAGLEVLSEDGRIRILNSLEKRLEHLWPELLPELLKILRPLAGDDETVA